MGLPKEDFDSSELLKRILSEFGTTAFMKADYPPLFDPGVAGGSVHSYVLAYLCVLGQHLGFISVMDLPVFDRMRQVATSRTQANSREPDSVWIDRASLQNFCHIEFQAAEPAGDLIKTAGRLLQAYFDSKESPRLLVLLYWYKGAPPDALPLVYKVLEQDGWTDPTNGVHYPCARCPVLVAGMSFRLRDDLLRFQTIHPCKVILPDQG